MPKSSSECITLSKTPQLIKWNAEYMPAIHILANKINNIPK